MTTETAEAQRPPHKWVAERINFSIAGVSLLRGGLRQPSVSTMETIEEVFDWSIRDQIDARHSYAPALERVLEVAYAKYLTEQAEADQAEFARHRIELPESELPPARDAAVNE